MNMRKKQAAATRRAILEALAQEIAASGAAGFSVQEVAERAGVTHRTVYNHFPTREALNDGLAAHVEEVLGETRDEAPDANMCLDDMRDMARTAFSMFGEREAHVRAYVMLMIASRTAATVHRDRTKRFEEVLERDAGPLPQGTAPLITGALRMMMSSWTWHLMTEHIGLSQEDSIRSTSWAIEALLSAVARGDLPEVGEST